MEANYPIGTTTHANQIGRKGTCLFIWEACPDCGKERWVVLEHSKPAFILCRDCARNHLPTRSSRWVGGRYYGMAGYIWVKLYKNDFFYPMTSTGGIVMEHRLVMAKSLGRCLQTWEFVHHKNGDKHDNQLENLEITTNGSHTIAHNKGYKDGYLKGLYDGHEIRIKQLESRVMQLETENVLLKTQQEAYSGS